MFHNIDYANLGLASFQALDPDLDLGLI